jgi:tryptophan synthase alpha chain
MAAAVGIDLISLLSPTTTDRRIELASARGRGFLYVISRLGVTGARDTLPEETPALVARVRSRTTMPIAVGFGLSRPEHVRQVGGWADAAVVGSALVSVVEAAAERPDLADRVERYVRWLKGEPTSGVAR